MVSILCYKSKTLSNGENPLVIRVCKNGKKKYQSLGISVKPEHWDFVKNKPKPNCPNKELILKIMLEKEIEFQKQILELKSEEKDYTASSLLKSKPKIEIKTVLEFYNDLINQFIVSGNNGNSRIYKDSLRSLNNFTNNKLDFPFNEIDVDWLKDYEYWMKSRNCKETTISLQFRTLRSAYNKAVANNYVGKAENPFLKFRISKFNTKTQKRSITKDEIKKIMEIDLTSQRYYIRFSRDIFIFSYLCGGINFSDMAYLKAKNVIEDRLCYMRKKTHKKISVPLNDKVLNIIAEYSTAKNGEEYLFPILDNDIHLTEQQQFNRIHKIISKVNDNLKKIAKMLGIETNLTSYVSRHSFATILKRSGVNIAIISEALGHSDLKTTQIYLDSFENSQIDEAMKNLL